MTPGAPRAPGRLGAARVFSTAGFRRILRSPAGRITNQTLLVALVLVFGTGVATVAIGSPSGRWAAIAHGIAGLVILLLIPWKSRDLSRRTFLRAGLLGAGAAGLYLATAGAVRLAGLPGATRCWPPASAGLRCPRDTDTRCAWSHLVGVGTGG